MNFKYLIIFCFSLIAINSFGQKGWEVGGWLGVSYYFGDLNTDYSLGTPGMALGLTGRYNFNERISTRLSLNYGRIKADDANSKNTYQQLRNLSFSSHIAEINPQLEFNFFPYIHGSSDRFYTPYLTLGASFFYFNPSAELNNQSYHLRNFGTEGQAIGEEYSTFNWALTFGGGLKWDLNAEWSLNFELSTRKIFTDYLDDVSTVYPDLNQLAAVRSDLAVLLSDRSLATDIAETGRQRGNSRDNDSFNFIGISLMKYFGRLECPKISDY